MKDLKKKKEKVSLIAYESKDKQVRRWDKLISSRTIKK